EEFSVLTVEAGVMVGFSSPSAAPLLAVTAHNTTDQMSQKLGVLAAASLIAVLAALTAFLLPGAFMARGPKTPRTPEARRPAARAQRPTPGPRSIPRLFAVFAAAFIFAGFALGALVLGGVFTSSTQQNPTVSFDM